MHLSQPVQAFFDAERDGSLECLLDAFAPDAVVQDEGRAHVGHPAIAAWWRDAKAKYRHKAEPLYAEYEDAVEKVGTRVTGTFPGSPVSLSFAFSTEHDRIVRLEIGT